MEDFTTFRRQVANNLAYYRKKCGLTQSMVAEKLNYSDKAISKWERGDGIPDAYVLSNLAIIYGVSIDTLLSTTKQQLANEPELEEIASENELKRKHKYISILSIGLALFVAVVVYVILSIVFKTNTEFLYVLLWGIPAASIVALVFNCIWGKAYNNTYIESVLMWTTSICIIITVEHYVSFKNIWLLLLIPFSFQLLIILWNNMRAMGKFRKKNKTTSK